MASVSLSVCLSVCCNLNPRGAAGLTGKPQRLPRAGRLPGLGAGVWVAQFTLSPGQPGFIKKQDDGFPRPVKYTVTCFATKQLIRFGQFGSISCYTSSGSQQETCCLTSRE